MMAAYTFISSLSRFRPSLTGLQCMAERSAEPQLMTLKIVSCLAVQSLMTLSLQVVLIDVTATLNHNVFNQ